MLVVWIHKVSVFKKSRFYIYLSNIFPSTLHNFIAYIMLHLNSEADFCELDKLVALVLYTYWTRTMLVYKVWVYHVFKHRVMCQ